MKKNFSFTKHKKIVVNRFYRIPPKIFPCGMIVALFSAFSFFISLLAFSDVIYLKNGREMEGLIEKEDGYSVVLNVGFGTIKLRKEEIDHIERDTPKERSSLERKWSYRYFMRPEFISGRLKDIANDFRDLEQSRNNAIKTEQTRDTVSKKINNLTNKLENLNRETTRLSKKLVVMKPEDDIEDYNALVKEYNTLGAQVRIGINERDMLKKQIPNLDKKISAYTDGLSTFSKKLRDRFYLLGGEATDQEKYFLERIEEEIADMHNDFTKYAIDYQQHGSHVIVSALLNGSVKANLMVDTGATQVVISKETARKLGIPIEDNEFSLSATMADGSKVKAYPVVLESIKVGNTQVRNVRAIVLAHSISTGASGLLGMSFLEHFVVKIDIKNNKLILEEFSP